jgi:hypothetical protein
MAYYFFHIWTDRNLKIDEIGYELPDHAEAIRHARLGARDLLNEMVEQGIDAFRWSIEIADETGLQIARVPLRLSIDRPAGAGTTVH